MYLGGWGNGWGGGLGGDPAYLPFAVLTAEDQLFRTLPEEVRAALEARSGEIHSAADLHRLAEELMLRR